MATAVLFTNYSTEDFSHTWDRVNYDFPKGQSMMMEEGLAKHFARHLAIRELNKTTDKGHTGPQIIDESNKAFNQAVQIDAEDETKVNQESINYNEKKKQLVHMKKEELQEVAKEKGVDVDEGATRVQIIEDIKGFEGK